MCSILSYPECRSKFLDLMSGDLSFSVSIEAIGSKILWNTREGSPGYNILRISICIFQ